MNSIYVATNLAEDLIVKGVVFLFVVSVGVAVYFRYELIAKPQVSARWKPADNGMHRPCRVGD
jgi:hypothetical protein